MAKKSFLDFIESPLPCSKDWNEMIGDERVRFCQGCEKNVYNLSAMSRREASRFVARNSGKVCVRYVRLADGRVQTADTRLFKITRRALPLAAGVFGAALTLSSIANAQTPAPRKAGPNKTVKTQKKTDAGSSQISFTVKDPNGTGIPNTLVKLTNPKTKQEFITVTNSEGIALFNLIPPATYEVKFSAPYFREITRSIRIKEAIEPNLEINLEVGVVETVGVFVDTWSEIPLFTLIAEEKNEEVKKLILSGFYVNTQSSNGQTALHVAVEFGNLEIVKFLLENKAKVNIKSKHNRTPLLMIDELPERDDLLVEIVRLLVAKGANVNVQDKSKNTALMFACDEEELEAVKILLEAGANPNLKDEDGETALEKTDSDEIKQLLIKYGAKE